MDYFTKHTFIIYICLLASIFTPNTFAENKKQADDLTQSSFKDSPNDRYSRLTDDDYAKVAKQLGVEIATIKAVSDIEAGASHKGFVSPGKPIINFTSGLFKSYLRKAGINPSKYTKSHSTAFSSNNVRKYGSYAEAQYARFNSAESINKAAAQQATYWGMFQIGGFNWKLCDADSPQDFVNMMSESEAMQLELFARFIINTGMVKDLQRKDWKSFSLKYNGNSALRRGYHTRMANAYRKYKNK